MDLLGKGMDMLGRGMDMTGRLLNSASQVANVAQGKIGGDTHQKHEHQITFK